MAFVSGFYKLITKKSLLKNVKKKEERNRVITRFYPKITRVLH